MSLKNIITSIAVLFTLIGGVVAGNTYLAKASDLKALEQRVDYRFLGEQITDIQNRVWKLEDRYNIGDPSFEPIPMSQDTKDQYRELKAKLENLIRQQKAMLEK